MKISDAAKNWKAPPKIQDLPEIPIDVEIYDDGEGENPETGKPYKFSYIILNDRQIRVPDSVLAQLQEQIAANPGMRAFKVKHNGKLGFESRFTIVPIL